MRLIPVANGSQCSLRVFGEAQISLHLCADIQPLSIGNIDVQVIPARVHRRKHGEQRFAGIERNRVLIRKLRLRGGLSLFGGLFLRLLGGWTWARGLALSLVWVLGVSLARLLILS